MHRNPSRAKKKAKSREMGVPGLKGKKARMVGNAMSRYTPSAGRAILSFPAMRRPRRPVSAPAKNPDAVQALPIAKPVMQNDNVMVQNTIPKMPNEMMLRTKADVVRLETGIASETSLLDDVFVVSVLRV